MKKRITLFILLLGFTLKIYSQCNCVINFANPSFECVYPINCGPQTLPPSWTSCMPGFPTPDTQPGYCGITLAPHDGNTYVGFLNYNTTTGPWQEGASQALCTTLTPGAHYSFTMWLATAASNLGCFPAGTGFGELYLYGGNSDCSTTNLLWTSGPISNTNNWLQKTCNFQAPASTIDHLLFLSYNDGNPNNNYVYILLDDLSPITNTDITVAPSTATICSNNITPITLSVCNGTGSTTYNWSNGASTSSISVNPSTTTTYTVTVTNNGTTSTSNAVVTVVPPPDIPIIVGDSIDCGNNVFSVSNYQSGITYTWAGGPTGTIFATSPTGQYTTVTWPALGVGNSTTIGVSAAASYFCNSIGTKIVYGCCSNVTHQYRNFVNTKASTIIGVYGNPVSTTDYININGVLTLDQSIEFKGCPNIFMGRIANIIVNSGVTFTLSYNNITGLVTHLQSPCQYMWDGIILKDNTSSLIVSGGSIIEDAKYAIVTGSSTGSGGLFQITNSFLQNNYRNIIIPQYSSTYNSFIKGSTLNCTRNLYTPYATDRTYAGITINNLGTAWTIGDATNLSNQNLFNNMWYGIYSTKTNNVNQTLNIVNNKFTNINASYNSTINANAGIAIYLSSTSGIFTSTFNIGGSTSQANIFGALNGQQNCYKGVEIYNNAIPTLSYNTFNNLAKGIYISNNTWHQPISLSNNNFYQITPSTIAGCAGSYGIYTNNTSSAISINNNHINDANTSTSYESLFGIVVSGNANGSPTPTTNITNNYTDQSQIGIYCLNSVSPTVSYNNNKITSTLNGIGHCGIYNANCGGFLFQNALITNNTIVWDNLINPGITESSLLSGIIVSGSANTLIKSNTITRAGIGIFCTGSSNPNKIQCNQMNQCYYGVGLGSADIGNQGFSIANYPPSGQAWDNSWYDQSPIGNTFRVAGSLGFTASCNWYYNNNISTFTLHPTPPPGQYNVSSLLFNTYALIPPAFCGTLQMLGNPQISRQDKLGSNSSILATTNISTYSDPFKYLMMQNVYRKIKADTTVLNLGLADDNLYQNLYYRLKSSNIGKFYNVNSFINNENFIAASAQNTTITPLNFIETNAKIANEIYLNYWTNHIFSFSSADSATLKGIAIQNPAEGGEGVYMARELLQYCQIDYNVPNTKRIIYNDTQTNKTSNIIVYPNPAKDNLTIFLDSASNGIYIVKLFDILGNIVFTKEINATESMITISLTNVKGGIYTCRIINADRETLYNGKLVIIK